MYLDTTLKTLEIVLSSAKTTNDCEWTADYIDTVSGTTFAPGGSIGISNGVTGVTVVGAPAASTQRKVAAFTFYNADTVNTTVTVRIFDGTNRRRVIATVLLPAQSLIYMPEAGWSVLGSSLVPVRTRQVFLTGSAATYTTPANARQLWVRMVAGGGGGSGSGTTATGAATAGGDSIFNSIHAAGGGSGGTISANAVAGAGGTGGTGTASVRGSGGPGGSGSVTAASGTVFVAGGAGGDSILGGGGGTNDNGVGGAAPANSGGGGGGAGSGNTNLLSSGGGGGGGEYVELIINAPSATYTYTVGAAGGAGTAGTSGFVGGAGGSGQIIVDEYY